MRTTGRIMLFAAGCVAIALGAGLSGDAPAAAQTGAEPLSKTCRVTRADDVELQKIEPFKVFDNLYYVGPCYVSVWLVTTPQGHVLFDSAQEPYVDHVIANIRKVGINLRDIKYIILSHGHLDHVGGAARLQEATGARVVAVAEDWTMIEELDGKSSRRDPKPNRMPKRDMVVKDGDTLTLGNQMLKFHQLPGHTPGVLMTEGITVYDGSRSVQGRLVSWRGWWAWARWCRARREKRRQARGHAGRSGEPADPQLGRARRLSGRRRARAGGVAQEPQARRPASLRGSRHVEPTGQGGSGEHGEDVGRGKSESSGKVKTRRSRRFRRTRRKEIPDLVPFALVVAFVYGFQGFNEARYADRLIRSSAVSFSTDGFIRPAIAPFRVPF